MKNVKSKMKLAFAVLLVPASLSACQPGALSDSSARSTIVKRFTTMQVKVIMMNVVKPPLLLIKKRVQMHQGFWQVPKSSRTVR